MNVKLETSQIPIGVIDIFVKMLVCGFVANHFVITDIYYRSYCIAMLSKSEAHLRLMVKDMPDAAPIATCEWKHLYAALIEHAGPEVRNRVWDEEHPITEEKN